MIDSHNPDLALSDECFCDECLPLFSHAVELKRVLTLEEERQILARPFGTRSVRTGGVL